MAPPSSPDKFPPEEAFTSPLITVEVGADESTRSFQIRKDVLSFYSGYFAAALNGRFVEAEMQVCKLPEEDAVIFAMFEHWMLHRTLYESTLEPASLLSYQLIARLWIFADSHDVPALQNIAVDTFVRKISLTAEPVTRADAHFILDNTVDSSLLRKLVHRLLCHNVSDTWRWLADDDFAKVVASLPGRGERWRGSFWGPHKASLAYPCEFHVHDDGHRCKN